MASLGAHHCFECLVCVDGMVGMKWCGFGGGSSLKYLCLSACWAVMRFDGSRVRNCESRSSPASVIAVLEVKDVRLNVSRRRLKG